MTKNRNGYQSPLARDANAGRVALVTGGGTGIGQATARELARTGARVVICGRRAGPLEATVNAIEKGGGECLAVQADIREPEQADNVVAEAHRRFDRVDILVNNAGGQFLAAAEEISLKGWRAVHRLTVDAAWYLTRSIAVRSMIPNRGGLIVFLGFSPRRSMPGTVHASAARAALENLACGLAIEWSRYGIRSVCVSCGSIHTEGLEAYGAETVAAWKKEIPLGRFGRPEEVASLIAFLASPGGEYITGTTLMIDGGVDAWGLAEPPPAPEPSAP